VDLEIPDDRIAESIKQAGFAFENITRLFNKERNQPTQTIKITFIDPQNRNTFVKIGLQIDSMHFPAESAKQNTNPVQCFTCLKCNHLAKYCKSKTQVCARCGANHHFENCSEPLSNQKFCNCNGKHLATSHECPNYLEQEKRIKKMINQYTSPTKQETKPIS
jgi:hypothetical protein